MKRPHEISSEVPAIVILREDLVSFRQYLLRLFFFCFYAIVFACVKTKDDALMLKTICDIFYLQLNRQGKARGPFFDF